MSVLCCRIPDFLYQLTCRHHPALANRPVALLGPDEHIWALSPTAVAAGLTADLRPRQAQLRCPDLHLHALDLAHCQTEQQTFLQLLGALELPVESITWGQAYLDLHHVAATAAAVQPIAAPLGRQLRHHLGCPLQPALGWDSGKFTAQAAAHHAAPGRMRLIDKAAEQSFLAPLPLTLLPLPAPTLQQLHWLGIRTLGQFAALPAAAILQRFGRPAKLAHAWARGEDRRPVEPTTRAAIPPLTLAFDPPLTTLPPLLAPLQAQLTPCLATLAANLQGCRRLTAHLAFANNDRRTLDLPLIAPLQAPAALLWLLKERLATLAWPAPLVSLTLHIEPGALPIGQLSLFPTLATDALPLAAIAEHLHARHGPIFFQAALTDPQHPVPDRRATLTPCL